MCGLYNKIYQNACMLTNDEYSNLLPSRRFRHQRRKLMGRHAAGESFIRGGARHSSADKLYCYANASEDAKHFSLNTNGLADDKRPRIWIPWKQWERLSEPGCLFLPGPDVPSMAYQRQSKNSRAFSICGITHTTASNRVMDVIGDMLIAPTRSWDALICTSNSVKNMVQEVLDAHASYLQDRFELQHPPRSPVQLPVIPLGVDCDSFALSENDRTTIRNQWRQKLGIGESDFVALYVGRLSFHAKVHPMPMFRGLEEAAKATGKQICLLMAGWFANDGIKKDFVEGAKKFCPSVKTVIVDGRLKEVRRTVWFAADIFTSLSDNIQETFGLTPIEAMAAGLPVVATDWDGYRDTVRDGFEGFLVPTWMSQPGRAEDLAIANSSGEITYDQYIGFQSQFTAVDVACVTRAYIDLIENPQLRTEMSKRAIERARSTFDWRVVIKSYEELFAELAERRHGAQAETPRMNPLRSDPTVLFQSYPTHHLSGKTHVSLTDCGTQSYVDFAREVSMNTFAIERFGLQAVVLTVLERLATNSPTTFGQLLLDVYDSHRDELAVERAVLWLAKIGAVSLSR